jgi:hypothetical protein
MKLYHLATLPLAPKLNDSFLILSNCFFRIQLHAHFFQLGVTLPSFDTEAWNGELSGS